MSVQHSESGFPEIVKFGPPLSVQYISRFTGVSQLSHPEAILGVIGYGANRPAFLPVNCPFVEAPLTSAGEEPIVEIWTASSTTQPRQIGPIAGSFSEDLAFGAITVDEAAYGSLERAVEASYHFIFDFLDATGFAAPIRFWNYLTAITDASSGLERYRRFNIGRHQAFLTRLRQPMPPAASCIGGDHGNSVIFFLAAHESPKAIENPRQMSAYSYPPVYGPCSPSFSRASIYSRGSAEALFLSGTASIVGHETRHHGNMNAQLAETIENLRVLINTARNSVPEALREDWAFKVYLTASLYREAVDAAINAAFGADCQRLYLRGDICRSDLLIEIEGFCHFKPDMAHS